MDDHSNFYVEELYVAPQIYTYRVHIGNGIPESFDLKHFIPNYIFDNISTFIQDKNLNKLMRTFRKKSIFLYCVRLKLTIMTIIYRAIVYLKMCLPYSNWYFYNTFTNIIHILQFHFLWFNVCFDFGSLFIIP